MSLSFASTAVRFFSFGVYCGRHTPLRLRMRRKSNPRNPKLPRFLRSTIRLFSRSEEHTSELQSRLHLVCRLLLEKKKNKNLINTISQCNNMPHPKTTFDSLQNSNDAT